MTSWDIRPDGVHSVLDRTGAVAADFDGQMTSLNSGMEGASGESSSGIVASVLTGFAQSAAGNIAFVFTRTGACITGAGGATTAYTAGDTEMAANAQAAATAAPNPLATMPGGGGTGPR